MMMNDTLRLELVQVNMCDGYRVMINRIAVNVYESARKIYR